MRIGGVLPYYYEEEPGESKLTALAGLAPYLDLAHIVRIRELVEKHVHLRAHGQGWTPAQLVTSGVLLNLAGGDCVDDLDRLNDDAGFCSVLRQVEGCGMPREQRREMERRFRGGRERAVPSPSSMRRFLAEFINEHEEKLRAQGKSFIPAPNEHLRGMYQVIFGVNAFAQSRKPERRATLDIDALLLDTYKEGAFYSYEKTKAFQALNVYWAEQGLVLHSEFRDGNVLAADEIERVFTTSLEGLPEGVEEILVRSDTAAYQISFLRYLHAGADGRFQVNGEVRPIRFIIGVDITQPFKEAAGQPSVVWHPLPRGKGEGQEGQGQQEWAEVAYVPNSLSRSKKDPEFRFIAIREVLAQQALPGMGGQQSFPFATAVFDGKTYKLHGIVTNVDWEGKEVIRSYRERCGKSEEAHAVMLHDLAGKQLPSGQFGANAAWWAMVILAFNINTIMKRLALGGKWCEKRLKAIRFAAINTPGRVLRHSRQLYVQISKECAELLRQMREGVAALAVAPT